MYTIEQLNAMNDIPGWDRPVNKVSVKKKGNFFTNLLPTAGGIGGSAAGAAIGTALLPGVGTLAGALLGGALGGGTGKFTENKIEGNKWNEGIGREAAINGIFGAGPLRLARLGASTARGMKTGLTLADALKAGGSAAQNMSIMRTAGNKIAEAGDDLVTKNFRFTPTQLTNFRKKYGEDAATVIKRHGLIGKDADQIRSAIIDPLQNEFTTVAAKIPNIPATTIEKALKSRYEPLLNSAVQDKQVIGQALKGQADELIKKYGTDIPAKELNKIRQEFDSLVNYTERTANPARYGVNKRSADVIRGALQDAADAAGLKTSTGATFKQTGQELSKLRQLTDNIERQSNLGRGSLPLNLPNLIGAGAGGVGAGLPGMAAGIVGTQMINSNLGRKVLANGANKVGDKLVAKSVTNPNSVIATAKRVAPVGLANALAQSSDGNSIATIAPTNNMPNTAMNANMLQLYPETEQIASESTSPFDPPNVEANVMQMMQSGATMKDVQGYLGMVETIAGLREAANPPQKPLSAEASKVLANANSGLQSLDRLEGALAQDPGLLRRTAIPGRSLAGGVIGNAAGTASYDNLSRNILDVITRLRTGAALTANEEKFYKSQLPQAFDAPDVVQQKLNMFRDLFSSVANRTGSASQSDLLTALSG